MSDLPTHRFAIHADSSSLARVRESLASFPVADGWLREPAGDDELTLRSPAGDAYRLSAADLEVGDATKPGIAVEGSSGQGTEALALQVAAHLRADLGADKVGVLVQRPIIDNWVPVGAGRLADDGSTFTLDRPYGKAARTRKGLIAAAAIAIIAVIGGLLAFGGDDDPADTEVVAGDAADDPADDGAADADADEPADDGGDAADGAANDEAANDEAANDEADGGGSVGEAGGGADADLADSLDLIDCPVGAHLEADGTVEIDFWHPFFAETGGAMEDLAAAFNASQDKIVVNVQAQGTYAELLGKYRESISFDDLPAVAITEGQTFRDMVDSGTVLPAQSCIEADGFDLSGIDSTVRGYYSIDGALYPGAMLVSSPILYYNRTSFAAAGLDPDNPPETIAEMRDAAQILKDEGIATSPLSLLLQGWFVDTWLAGAGVPIVNADNGRAGNATEANLTSPEAIELYTLLKEMNDAGLVAAFSNTPGQVEHYFAALDQSQVAMLIETSVAATTIAGFLGGTSNLSDLVEGTGVDAEILGASDLSIDLHAAPLPGLREPGKVFVSGGAMYMTANGSPAEQAAAWEFIKFVNQVDQQKVIHLRGSYLPVSDEVASDPQVQQVWANDAAGMWLETSYEQVQGIDPDFPGPAVGPFSEQREIFQQSLEELFLAGGDPETVLQAAEDAFNEALEAYTDANF
ncbi:MAG: extracellular solute-binding protein [Actinomycetota bacterium]